MTRHQGMFRKGWADGDRLGEDEIPTDPALPQLAVILDPTVMREVLQEALPSVATAEPRLEIAGCRIANVSYRPGRECQVSYALDMADPNGNQKPRFATARVTSDKRTRRVLVKRLSVARARGVAFAYLSDHQMVLCGFPNDLRVHTLHRLIDSDEFEKLARTTLDDGNELRPQEETVQVSIVSYRPERSCLLRCVLRGATRQPRVVYARIYRDDRGAHVHQVMSALWAAKMEGLVLAEPLGYDPGARVLFQAAVDGVPLVELIGEADFLDHVAKTARCLVAIHQTPVRTDRSRCPTDDLDWITLIGRGFAQVLPKAGDQLKQILEQLRQSKPSLPDQDRRMIHGDFSARQVLAVSGQVSVIDFDDACMADPCADLGTFLARLEKHISDPALRRRSAKVFSQQYETSAEATLALDRVGWYQAIGFVRLAFSSLARLKPGWSRRVDENLDRARALLVGHSR